MAKDTDDGPEHERIEDPNANTVTVDLEEPDDDDDDDGDAEPPRAAKSDKEGQVRDKATGKWTAKKQERQKEHKERVNWRTEKEAIERRLSDERAAYERRIAEVEQRLARQAPQQPAQTTDPYQAKLNELEEALTAELQLMETDEKRGLKRYNELRRQEQMALIDQAMARRAQQAQEVQRNLPQRNTQYDARKPFIESEFPWTMDQRNAELNQKAWAYRSYLINVEGRPDTIDTDREALAHIQAKFGGQYGLRPPARPSQETRDRYVRPASGSSEERGGSPRSIELPAVLAEGTGLDPAALARALRER